MELGEVQQNQVQRVQVYPIKSSDDDLSMSFFWRILQIGFVANVKSSAVATALLAEVDILSQS